MPFLHKIGFLIFCEFFDFFDFFVNLYPTSATKCCMPLLSLNVVSHCVATKYPNLDKKMIFGGGYKNEFSWFYTPLQQCLSLLRLLKVKYLLDRKPSATINYTSRCATTKLYLNH